MNLHWLALASVAAACAPAAPDTPTWADVAPILTAHCARCHGAPAIGGAPPSFRLDRYDDTPSAGGKVLGAAAMAEWIASRAQDGSMPPRLPLSEVETETLVRWYEQRPPTAGTDPLLPPLRTDGVRRSAPPSLELTALANGRDVDLSYHLTDADDAQVVGDLVARRGATDVPLATLQSGAGAFTFDATALPAGDYQLLATLYDSTGIHSAGGSPLQLGAPRTTPRVTLSPATAAALEHGSYLSTAELPWPVEVTVLDGDTPTASVTVTLIDERAPSVPVERITRTIATGTPSPFAIGSAQPPPGITYRVIIEATDGTSSHRLESGRFRIASATTGDTFRSIADAVLGPHCYGCHGSFQRIPGLTLDFTRHTGTAQAPGVYELRRRIYQRAVAAQNMPPGSAQRSGNVLSAESRERLAAWLFAGAPE